jgi:ribonuclease HII
MARLKELLKVAPGVCGMDEAGRGPLAGPVVAAAVILPRRFDATGIDDSKKLTREQRETAAVRIRKQTIWAVGICSVEEVDRLNILEASMEAMRRALAKLDGPYKRIVVDGNRLPRGVDGQAVIKGDGIYACIAAASILAKTVRDALMTELAAEHPRYGFDRHFGYSTPEHLTALREHGPCIIHRRSFAPVRECEQLPLFQLS